MTSLLRHAWQGDLRDKVSTLEQTVQEQGNQIASLTARMHALTND